MKKKNQEGFTLIELMVVIVIIGILVAIALPNFIGATDRAKIANVKSNAHTVQTMLESYGVDFGGKYPTSVANLQGEAQTGAYWKALSNPFDGLTTTSLETFTGTFTNGGAVGYNMQAADNTKYFVYGSDKNKVRVKDKGTDFMLSNS
ncbi:MAG: type II secretion system protein [Candidatus Sericytochromatia bacterium]|nr:type II secretion system protein [Candidatus Sericytochromatia bacterium]